MDNSKEISSLNQQIAEQTLLERQNQKTLGKIADLEAKISGFGQTQAILDSASAGTKVWTKVLAHVSDFFNGKRNIWLTKLSSDNTHLALSGYALSKRVLTDFAYSVNSAELKSVNYEPMRKQNVYKFSAIFNLTTFEKEKK